MVFIDYPRRELTSDPVFANWKERQALKSNCDWKTLLPWLDKHVGRENERKCWYSEAIIQGNRSSDIEHFRPKNERKKPSNKHCNELNKVFKIPQEFLSELTSDTVGYPNLKCEYSNYRISSPHVNQSPGKSSVFPLWPDPQKLTNSEYPILLDPTSINDTSLLIVLPTGEIAPKFIIEKESDLTGFLKIDFSQEWKINPIINYIRAAFSIVIYQLNHSDLRKGRSIVYKKITKKLEIFLVMFSRNSDFLEYIYEELVCATLPSGKYSLTARCAIENFCATLANETSAKRHLLKILSLYKS